jgi:hypothetical protein
MKQTAIVLAVGAVLLSALPASAQVIPTPEDMGLNYTFYAGASVLTNDKMNNTTSLMLGIAYYDSAGGMFGQYTTFGLTADWTPIERNDGTSVQYVPVLFNYRQYGFISSYRVFVNLGVGVIGTTDSINDMKLSSGANFGWSAGLGFDMTNSLNFQARFIGGQNPGDDGLVSIQLGYRF